MRRRRIIRAILIIIAVLAAAAGIVTAVILISRSAGHSSNTRFLASTSGAAEVYVYDDYEKRLFRTSTDIKRGTEVTLTDETYTENGRTYIVVKYGDDTFYVKESCLVTDLNDIVQEKEKWVRTSVTVYDNYEGPEISSFIKKGSHLVLTGYDELLEDGNVNMYEIECDGVKGWVYGKYLVDTEKEANAINEEIYEIHKDRNYIGSDLHGGTAADLDWFPYEHPHFPDNPILEDARCMYLNIKSLETIDKYLELAKANGVNSICMDIKDGQLVTQFDCAAELSPTSNSVYGHQPEAVEAAVQKIKDAGLYLICRIVVFNDTLYGGDHPEDCIESEESTQTWPSAYSRNVWYYNVRLAEEVIQRYAPNEIQFDYVRFPEESYRMSESGTTDFKNVYSEEKCEAIQNFLFYACDYLHRYNVYVSADVFAECAGKYISAYGQYFPAISNVADAVSAMPYTDHFGTTVDTWTDGYTTVNDWAQRCAARQTEIETPGIARTWLTCYNVPWWHPTVTCDEQYFGDQARALYDAGVTGGFLSWNGISNYTIYEQMAPAWGFDYGYGTGDALRTELNRLGQLTFPGMTSHEAATTSAENITAAAETDITDEETSSDEDIKAEESAVAD